MSSPPVLAMRAIVLLTGGNSRCWGQKGGIVMSVKTTFDRAWSRPFRTGGSFPLEQTGAVRWQLSVFFSLIGMAVKVAGC